MKKARPHSSLKMNSQGPRLAQKAKKVSGGVRKTKMQVSAYEYAEQNNGSKVPTKGSIVDSRGSTRQSQ